MILYCRSGKLKKKGF